MTATAELELRVPRDGEQLERDAETVLERVDGVARADVDQLTGVSPTLNDLRVGVAVSLRFESDDPTATDTATLRETLADGFGVYEVSAVELDPA